MLATAGWEIHLDDDATQHVATLYDPDGPATMAVYAKGPVPRPRLEELCRKLNRRFHGRYTIQETASDRRRRDQPVLPLPRRR